MNAWKKVTIARLNERPNAKFYIQSIFDKFIEFHGDRSFGDDKAIIGGIGSIGNVNITVIGIAKGQNTKENLERNFGMPHPEGYRKALRLMKQAEKFKRPVICFVDTPGAFCGVEAEERGQGYAIAQNLVEMMTLKTPIISIFIGEGGSGGALALGVADRVWMLENSIYSILSPEGFASILWKDASRAKDAANAMKITANELLDFGIIDKVIKEPFGGAHKNPEVMAKDLKQQLIEEIEVLRTMNLEELMKMRYDKFRNMA
ncbi:acetyl-CoA carboxylase carboxyltransferase subunit alpha [Clostridium cellulovorans]|uniref:Acetyl-coenzyme A carboxylase carboxyl transferase subunit alpha n=1 Tax=Clostridium cellulovorans (strain ATCC 35296 / DSM 3052 / OCM 3 / 743B) TaxID=573061 RepID=D9SMD9_CLOC7|nr:acetyl-CoA carboxylase carboxyltransferase subunit alpha [Clostridium cellulovorans]ADL53795.1 acetyl-CoA carboxylase, carboxyl transferase, alpha subunit [Clostridium cellulovorans 743B]